MCLEFSEDLEFKATKSFKESKFKLIENPTTEKYCSLKECNGYSVYILGFQVRKEKGKLTAFQLT